MVYIMNLKDADDAIEEEDIEKRQFPMTREVKECGRKSEERRDER